MRSNTFELEQVAIRMVKEPPLYADYPLNGPDAVIRLMADTLKDYDREVVAVINLRGDLRPINVNLVSMGTLDKALVSPREFLKSMVLSNAAGIMMVHNHPSGRLNPSKEDIMMKENIAHLCGLMDVTFYEHVILGPGSEYYSFHQKGIVPLPELGLTGNIENVNLGGFKVAETSTEYTSGKDYYEMKREELREITDKLEQGVADIFASDRYKEMLDMIARFPEYSANNSLLILLQRPDARLCQSYTGWKSMDRYVKKGEKGIKILAPTPYTVLRDEPKLDAAGKQIYDKDGEAVMETKEIKVIGYKVVNTFDISQTEGKELPTIGVNELTGDVNNYGMMFQALVDTCPVPIAFEKIGGGAKGYYHLVEERIAIQEGMSEVQTVKTAIHEMAHQKLHAHQEKDQKQTRNSKEVEAESVAYTVCQHYGIDTSDYSFSYVVGWSEGKETPELKASLETIRKTAAEMIHAIDEKMKELQAEKTKEQSSEKAAAPAKETEKSAPESTVADRKEALAQLVKKTAEQCAADASKGKKAVSGKKQSVRQKLQEEKDKAPKTLSKKGKEKEVAACIS